MLNKLKKSKRMTTHIIIHIQKVVKVMIKNNKYKHNHYQ